LPNSIKMATDFSENSEKTQPIFYCKKCDYTCFKKQYFIQHNNTQKHKNMFGNGVANSDNNTDLPNKYVCGCGKGYEDRSGLWKHKKTCNNVEDTTKNITVKNLQDNPMDIIISLIKQNSELKDLIIENNKQNFEIQKQLIGNSQTINNNTYTNNSHNKTFNLNFFLNETCKDAMNLSEFIDSMKIQLSDLENVGKMGFVDGISNIIIKNLEALDVEKRPIHCCDAKRETMYIKDQDKWEKEDNELKRMKELVRTVRDKNISMVNTWRDLYPECVKSDSKKTTQYNQIYMEAFGGETGGEKATKQEKEEKIISKIAKSVVIDKNLVL
jgi:hypothetical protein